MAFKLEKKLKKQGYTMIIGVDEAGRGPLCGPVVAAATLCRISNFQFPISKQKELDLIRDSKKLSEKQRERIHEFIQENFFVGVGICDHKTIDRLNILQATFLAMKAALTDLKSKIKNQKSKLQCKNKNYFNDKCIVLIDGNRKIPGLKLEQLAIIGGDKKVKSISAASIVAKVTRDRIMQKLHEKYPAYGFDRHKGYGTQLHLEQLKKNGPSPIHRLSFKVRQLL